MSPRKFFLLILLLALSFSTFADFLPGFTCSRSPKNDSSVCVAAKVRDSKTSFRYSNSVVIVVPDGVVQPSDIVLHFHGFRGVCDDNSINSMLLSFGFLDVIPQLQELNAIYVIPRSEGKETTFNNELAPQFDAFTQWIQNEVGRSIIDWHITGHSGAYAPIGTILNQQGVSNRSRINIRDVVLLDATYSTKSSYYNQWKPAAQANPTMQVYSVTSASTLPGTKMLTTLLKRFNIPLATQPATTPHCDIPKKDLGPILSDIAVRP